MKLARPQTAANFAQQVRALVDGGWHRAAGAYARQYAPQFMPLLSDEERGRIMAVMAAADAVVDLQDREAQRGTAPPTVHRQ
jgi:hypothetical protein